MASSKYTRSPTIKRILREAAELAQSPSPDFHAAPANDSDLFDWHFTIRGPPSSAFSNGIYHGRIILPPTYPLRPPSFRFLNPSGRFEVNREICLSISGHHEETWMPAWGVRTALVALRSFMETDPKGQLGGMECTNIERENFARESISWTCNVCKKKNKDILWESQDTHRGTGLGTDTRKSQEVSTTISKTYQGELVLKDEENKKAVEISETKTIGTDEKTKDVLTDIPLISTRPLTYPESSRNSSTMSQTPNRFPSINLNSRINQAHQEIPVRPINEEPPLWIDRVILTIVICLVAMVMKVLLGLGREISWETRQE
ncbi:Ubiquitin-conjugating enzyme E2 J1 [Golovinomyces cichoracearum]|uniref:Ubiquitin-conjugating enzyme E2 J1 n=1 Tax=Golovinomyces cichoracearum TaxID=62708 RepID=A0A420J4H9_9PEZI|nr:Ubiquitin-conjugating enzyme E2 J1 [Golovinomyces cichoracearum]